MRGRAEEGEGREKTLGWAGGRVEGGEGSDLRNGKSIPLLNIRRDRFGDEVEKGLREARRFRYSGEKTRSRQGRVLSGARPIRTRVKNERRGILHYLRVDAKNSPSAEGKQEEECRCLYAGRILDGGERGYHLTQTGGKRPNNVSSLLISGKTKGGAER